MKVLLTISCILLTAISFGQIKKVDTVNKIARPAKILQKDVVPARLLLKEETIFGDFKIDKYSILSRKTPSNKELNTLIGSLVRIQRTDLTGDEIEPSTFNITEVTYMSSSEYIYKVFGREIREQEPDLPETVKVHKTDHLGCYGIIEVGDGRVAIPYKGVLLFLSKK